jgi:hypothetical protein
MLLKRQKTFFFCLQRLPPLCVRQQVLVVHTHARISRCCGCCCSCHVSITRRFLARVSITFSDASTRLIRRCCSNCCCLTAFCRPEFEEERRLHKRRSEMCSRAIGSSNKHTPQHVFEHVALSLRNACTATIAAAMLLPPDSMQRRNVSSSFCCVQHRQATTQRKQAA